MNITDRDFRIAYGRVLGGMITAENFLRELSNEDPRAGAEMRELVALHATGDAEYRFRLLSDAFEAYVALGDDKRASYVQHLAVAVRLGLPERGRMLTQWQFRRRLREVTQEIHSLDRGRQTSVPGLSLRERWMNMQRVETHWGEAAEARRTFLNVAGVSYATLSEGTWDGGFPVPGSQFSYVASPQSAASRIALLARRRFNYLADVLASPKLDLSVAEAAAREIFALDGRIPGLLESGHTEASMRRNLSSLTTRSPMQFRNIFAGFAERVARVRKHSDPDEAVAILESVGPFLPHMYVLAAEICDDLDKKSSLLSRALDGGIRQVAEGEILHVSLGRVGYDLALLEVGRPDVAAANDACERQHQLSPGWRWGTDIDELRTFMERYVPVGAMAEILRVEPERQDQDSAQRDNVLNLFLDTTVSARLERFNLNDQQALDVFGRVHELLDSMIGVHVDVRPRFGTFGQVVGDYELSGNANRYPALVAASNYLSERLATRAAPEADYVQALHVLRVVHHPERKLIAARNCINGYDQWRPEWRRDVGIRLLLVGGETEGRALLQDLDQPHAVSPEIQDVYALVGAGQSCAAAELLDSVLTGLDHHDSELSVFEIQLHVAIGDRWRVGAEQGFDYSTSTKLDLGSRPQRIPAVQRARALEAAAAEGLATEDEAVEAWLSTGMTSAMVSALRRIKGQEQVVASLADVEGRSTERKRRVQELESIADRDVEQNVELIGLHLQSAQPRSALTVLAETQEVSVAVMLDVARGLISNGHGRQAARLADDVAAMSTGEERTEALMMAGRAYKIAWSGSTALDRFATAIEEGAGVPQEVFEVLMEQWRLDEAIQLMKASVDRGDVYSFIRFVAASSNATHGDALLDHVLSNDVVDVAIVAAVPPGNRDTSVPERIATCRALARALEVWTDMGPHDKMRLQARQAELFAGFSAHDIKGLDGTLDVVRTIDDPASALAQAAAMHVVSTALRVDAASGGRRGRAVAGFLEEAGTYLCSREVLYAAAERYEADGDMRSVRRCSDRAKGYTKVDPRGHVGDSRQRSAEPEFTPDPFGAEYSGTSTFGSDRAGSTLPLSRDAGRPEGWEFRGP